MDKKKVEFTVPLSGSNLFDIHTLATAKNLVSKFPGLEYDYRPEEKKITIYGELNEYWYNEWCKAMFEIGEIRS